MRLYKPNPAAAEAAADFPAAVAVASAVAVAEPVRLGRASVHCQWRKRQTFRLSVGYVSLLAAEFRPSGFSTMPVC